MAIEKYSSERNIKIVATLYRGISEEQKHEVFCQLYEIYHSHSSNFRFRVPQSHFKLCEKIKTVGFTLTELNQIEAYEGTKETCEMMRQMIDVVRGYWND